MVSVKVSAVSDVGQRARSLLAPGSSLKKIKYEPQNVQESQKDILLQ